jgi:hypothetical protein
MNIQIDGYSWDIGYKLHPITYIYIYCIHIYIYI